VICVSVFAEEYLQALKAIDRFGEKIDLVELRLDTAATKIVEEAVGRINRPLILACHPASHGGRFKGTEAERLALLRASLRFRPLYIDIEFGTIAEELIREQPEMPYILSFHDTIQTPVNLGRLAESLLARKPAIAKLVTKVTTWMDNLRILQVAHSLSSSGAKIVCFGSGEEGIYSRVLAPANGSYLTYCSVDGAGGTSHRTLQASQRERENEGLRHCRRSCLPLPFTSFSQSHVRQSRHRRRLPSLPRPGR